MYLTGRRCPLRNVSVFDALSTGLPCAADSPSHALRLFGGNGTLPFMNMALDGDTDDDGDTPLRPAGSLLAKEDSLRGSSGSMLTPARAQSPLPWAQLAPRVPEEGSIPETPSSQATSASPSVRSAAASYVSDSNASLSLQPPPGLFMPGGPAAGRSSIGSGSRSLLGFLGSRDAVRSMRAAKYAGDASAASGTASSPTSATSRSSGYRPVPIAEGVEPLSPPAAATPTPLLTSTAPHRPASPASAVFSAGPSGSALRRAVASWNGKADEPLLARPSKRPAVPTAGGSVQLVDGRPDFTKVFDEAAAAAAASGESEVAVLVCANAAVLKQVLAQVARPRSGVSFQCHYESFSF